ncbi:hypothetical protein CAI21_15770 [Alkalilimnicola ehrlichii]|uniref:Mut7-C RNAse domain-containing protein n=1 Tax=Alkalilimnicola ehrlichii TaxID=351052 RepID=UPI000E2E5823|nr:hypothetical protein CAI21_15770 [Alkalilimnicola ehrlichii]
MAREIVPGPAVSTEAIRPRLLCDEMLLRLARWLRAAGYDTALAVSGMQDRAVFGKSLPRSAT